MNAEKNNRTRYLVQLSLLIAIQIVLTLTPFGFIQLGFMDITIMHLPVLIGAVVMGPLAGGVLGTVFGLSSLFTAMTRATISSWPFNPLVTGSISSVIIALVPRIIFGIICAYVFKLLIKAGLNRRISAGIAGAVGSISNTLLVLGGIYFLLGERYANEMSIALEALGAIIIGIISTNGIVEAVVAVLICAALAQPLGKIISKKQ